MKFILKTWSITLFFGAFLALAAACGSESPASTGIPFQYPDDTKIAVQKTYDDWWDATQDRDGSAMYALLARNITDRCTLGQLEQQLAMDDDAYITPELDVKQIFLDPVTAEEGLAFMLMELRNEPRPGPDGERDSAIESFPFPIYREDGRWLMGLRLFFIGDGCPFVGETRTQEATEAATPTGQ